MFYMDLVNHISMPIYRWKLLVLSSVKVSLSWSGRALTRIFLKLRLWKGGDFSGLSFDTNSEFFQDTLLYHIFFSHWW